MKQQKFLFIAFGALILAMLFQPWQKAQALELTGQSVGVIDIGYIINNSKQTQALKQKQDALTVELQKFGITEKEKMLNSKTSLNKQDLEKELITKISLKKESLEKQYREDFILVQQQIKTAVDEVEKKKHIDLVFTKDSLVSGGIDITQDVIEILDSNK